MPEKPIEELAVDLGDGLRVEWDTEAVTAFSRRDGEERAAQPWRLAGGPPDWKRWDSLRVLSATFEDGATLVAAALRPRKAKGHNADLVRGILARHGAPAALDELLVSMQFDGSGRLQRVNAEVYVEPDSVPVRASGDLIASTGEVTGDEAMEINALDMRMDGHAGFGTLDVLRRA